eukprot:gene11505-8189_t
MSEQKERKQPPNIEGMFTLKVDNISQGTNEDLLREKFSSFGDVGDVYIPRKRGSTDNRGYAFVRFTTEEVGRRAMEGMTGQEIDGNVIGIQEAKQPRPENPRQAMREKDRARRGDDRRDDRRSDRRRDSRDRDYGRDRRDYGRDRSRDRDYRDRSRDRSRDRDYGGYRDRDRSRDRGYDSYHHSGGGGGDYQRDYRDRSRSPRGRY